MQFTHFTATLWTPLLYQERSMCFMTHQAVFLSASWLYHKCFIPLFLNKHLRDESVEMSIQRKIFLEGSLDFKKVNSASIGATWPYQASPKLNNVTHFPSIAVHICNTWHYRLPADLTKCHTLLAPTKNCKINHFCWKNNNCQLFLPPTKKPLKMDFRFSLKHQHLDWIK